MCIRLTICTLALFAGGCVAASPSVVPIPIREPAIAIDAPAVKAAGLPERCERLRDGNKIARIQTEVERLVSRLREDPEFGWAKYEHVPCFQVVLAFTDGRPRPSVIMAASSELRPYLRFERAGLSHAEFQRAFETIVASLRATGVRYLIALSPEAQQLDIGVRSEADALLVRSVIPTRYRAITRVVPSGYAEPMPERD